MPKSIKTVAAKTALAAACVAASFVSTLVWAQEPAPGELAASPADAAAPAQPVDGSAPAEASDAGAANAPANEPAAMSTPETVATIPVPQSAEQGSSAPEAESSKAVRIEDVTVTATKRAQSLRDIPQSITAISGEKLENEGKLNLIDFITQTPGVTATQASSGYTRFTVRGISTDTAPGSPTPSPVGVFIGDTAFTDPYIANIVPDLSAFDLAGIQVLKGPQGTLFGGAALSGAVRYELQEPVQGEWQFRGFSQLISPRDGSLAVTSGAAINIPLLKGDNLALRFAYVKRNYPGVIDNGRTGEKDVDHGGGDQYRAILLWEPQDWKIKFTHLSQNFFTPNGVYTVDSPEGPRENSVNIMPVPAKNDFGMDSLEAGYNFDSMRLVSLSSYVFKNSYFNIDGTSALFGKPPAGYPVALGLLGLCTENSKSYSQELRLQSTGNGPFQWIAGLYYYTYRMYFNLGIDTPADQGLLGPNSALSEVAGMLGIPLSLVGDNTTFFEGTSNAKSTERAAFFDLSYKPWDRLELSAGARAYQTRVSGGFIANGLLIRLENDGMDANSLNQISEHGINPKATATFHFSDDISLYAQVAKGYRFGGIQYVPSTPTNGVPPVFKSDTLWNHELGLRTSWLEHTLNADLTAFYIRYKNPIITQATPGIAINFNDNVSAAVSTGLEASLLWYTPLDGLSLSLTGALTDAHITAPFKAAGGQQIEPGQQMPGTAPKQMHASVQYLRPVGDFNIGASTGYTYIGQGFADLQHSVEINGYGSFDAGLVFTSDAYSLHPKLALNFSNILDVTQANAGGTLKPIVPGTSYDVYAVIPPRTISLRLSFEL